MEPLLTSQEQARLSAIVSRILGVGYTGLNQQEQQERNALLRKKYPGIVINNLTGEVIDE